MQYTTSVSDSSRTSSKSHYSASRRRRWCTLSVEAQRLNITDAVTVTHVDCIYTSPSFTAAAAA